MNPQAENLNLVIKAENASIYDMLSEKGKNIFFPKKGILGQTAEAKGTRINATIGAAIEDDGSPMRLETIASKINIDPSLIFPYAPSYGRSDLRKKWQSMIYQKNPSLCDTQISLPVVTCALTHGVSMAGYLFINPEDEVIVPDLFWGNYNLSLCNGYGAKLKKFNLFKNHHFDIDSFSKTLNSGTTGKKILILNFPNNPSGYTPTEEEMNSIVSELKRSALDGNKIVCITDDAYFGLVYETGIARESIFSSLSNLHENILAVKLDGATKEDYAWGFRVGFITYGIKGGNSDLYSALESKTAGAIRGNISNAANISQSLILSAYNNEEYPLQKKEKYEILKKRYIAVKKALSNSKYTKYFTPLPFNSGYFMCIKLAKGINSEEIRQLLIKKYGIGTICLTDMLRIAYSAVPDTDIEDLFEGIYQACREYLK